MGKKIGLPMELVSLVHHVELNKAGWWDVAAQRLILAAMWIAGRPLAPHQVIDEIRQTFQLELSRARAEAQMDCLRQDGILLSLPDGRLKISEQSCHQFERDVEEAEGVQRRARDKFAEVLNTLCPDLDPEEVWRTANEFLFLPAVREMGCRFYNLIADVDVAVSEIRSMQDFLDQYPTDVSSQLREAVSCYLSCGDADVRSYILRYLSAYFFLEAGNLSDPTIQALTRSMEKSLSYRIFVDTNFIFSVLGVHANPSDEAAEAALSLINRLSDRVSVQLYFVPPTMDETRQAIQWRLDRLKDLRLTPNMARASLRQPEVTGFIRRLAEEADRLGNPLVARDYFGPYATNLIQILRAKGLEFYNADLSKYRTNQLVMDDLNSQMEYEQEKYGEDAKTYETMLHDMVLWHFVHDQRPDVIESPLEAQSWIVTVDYRFLGFDAFKGRTLHDEIPVCLHPTALIQLLQFWVPRTEQFEDTLYSSWVWPMLFQGFDLKSEEVTIRILQALSRFENIDDLPPTILDRILVNEALRQRISTEDETGEQIRIVRNTVVEEARRDREAADAQIDQLTRDREEAEGRLDQLARDTSQLREQMRQLESQAAKDREARDRAEKARAEVEAKGRSALEELRAELQEATRVHASFRRNALALLPLVVFATVFLGVRPWLSGRLWWLVVTGLLSALYVAVLIAVRPAGKGPWGKLFAYGFPVAILGSIALPLGQGQLFTEILGFAANLAGVVGLILYLFAKDRGPL